MNKDVGAVCGSLTPGNSSLSELLKDLPDNWGRWGADDEIGALNYLTPSQILKGIGSVVHGKTFTLMIPVGDPKGDPNVPGRIQTSHLVVQDYGSYESGKSQKVTGGLGYTDDVLFLHCHGTSHCDALGHVFLDGLSWNGYSAATNKGGVEKAAILPIANRGIVGRTVLLDVARYKQKDHLDMNEQITLQDLLLTAKYQGIEIERHDILMIRTGIFNVFYDEGPSAFYREFNEPGITYEPALVQWFYDMEIPVLGTDTLSNEQSVSSTTEATFPLHAALLRNMGIVFNEALWLDDWAKDSALDHKYDALYVAAPLKVVRGTAAPINPVVIK